MSTGHCHPHIVSAVQKQAGEIVHAQQVKTVRASCLPPRACPVLARLNLLRACPVLARFNLFLLCCGGSQSVHYSKPMLDLIDAMLPIVPGGLDSFFFANSGSEAVEGALRLARQVRSRTSLQLDCAPAWQCVAWQLGRCSMPPTRACGCPCVVPAAAGHRQGRGGGDARRLPRPDQRDLGGHVLGQLLPRQPFRPYPGRHGLAAVPV
eukprot:SAG22_NODE_4_length_44774_cov_362.122149_31_plen_208_part_00